MSCIEDTDSIDLEIAAGTLSADVIIDPSAAPLVPNPLVVGASGLYVYGADGWIALPGSLAYSSASSPTYVATTSADLTAFISPGAKVKLVQSGTTRYFTVAAITSGSLTLYGGDQQVLANAAITVPWFSVDDQPRGFPALTCTVLPTVAYDGMEVDYVADASNGIVWRLRYRAASGSTHKWEALGPTPLSSEVATSEASSSASYGNLATTGPTITLPRAGDYEAVFGALLSSNYDSAGETLYAALKLGAAATADAESVRFGFNGGGIYLKETSVSRSIKLAGRAASDVILMQFKRTTQNSNSFALRFLKIFPVRLS